jgi:N6-adenosine-specific RNA methylase IME4
MMTPWPFDDLTPFKYGAILCDPPWHHVMRSDAGQTKSPSAHYDTMSAADLKALPVSQLAAPDCMMFMWSTWPHLDQALALMSAWGFTYKTGGSWTKTTATGKRCFGTGYVLRSATEPFLIGTIGAPKYRSRSIRNLIESERREHSRKLPEARAMIDALLPDVWGCELFAREAWKGRDVWGNQAEKFA